MFHVKLDREAKHEAGASRCRTSPEPRPRDFRPPISHGGPSHHAGVAPGSMPGLRATGGVPRMSRHRCRRALRQIPLVGSSAPRSPRARNSPVVSMFHVKHRLRERAQSPSRRAHEDAWLWCSQDVVLNDSEFLPSYAQLSDRHDADRDLEVTHPESCVDRASPRRTSRCVRRETPPSDRPSVSSRS